MYAVLCIKVADDESDELVEQINLHGNFLESMDGLEAFSKCANTQFFTLSAPIACIEWIAMTDICVFTLCCSACSVVELCLSNNFIQEVSFNALEQLVHLRILDLSANR